jgi:hypothetical protein
MATIVQMLMEPYRLKRMERLECIALYGNTALLYIAMYFVIVTAEGTVQIVGVGDCGCWAGGHRADCGCGAGCTL